MDLRHLRYFAAVAEEGTFARAAARLHVAQPALSRQIRDLEREIDADLFEHGGRAAHLSAAGEAVFRAARTILQEAALGIERARRTSRGLAGRCIVCCGAVPTWSGLVARLIVAVRHDYPSIELQITEGVGAAQWDAIRSGTADLAIGMTPTREFADLARWRLVAHPFDAALVSSNHPLAGRARISLADLGADPIIAVFGTDSDHHAMCAGLASRAMPPAALRNAANPADAFAQVAAGVGWTPFNESFAPWLPPGTVSVPVDDLSCSMPLHVIWKAGELPAVVRRVRAVLVAVARAHPGGRSLAEKAGVLGPATGASAAPSVDDVGDELPDTTIPLALGLRHLRYFLAAIEAGSVGRAAQRLSITQPALSRQVRELERLVGVALLERNPKGVVATTAGEAFAQFALRILELADGARAEAHRATRGHLRRCVVATIPAPSVGRLVAALSSTAAVAIPGVQISMAEIPTPAQPEALMTAQIDIGIRHAFTSVTPYLDFVRRHPLFDDPACCALLPPDHPLAARADISLTELEALPFLFMPRPLYPAFYDRVITFFSARNFHPRVEQPYEGLQTTWSLARRGAGWCIGFRTNLWHPPAGLAAVLVRDLDIPLGIEMIHRRDETRGAVLAVAERIRRIATALAAEWAEGPSLSAVRAR